MRLFVLSLLCLVFSCESVSAQVGWELEKIKARKNIIETFEKEKYGKNFILVTTDEKKGVILEMWFLEGVCVSARWMDRGGEPTQDYKELTWKVNFGEDKVVKKSDKGWEGEGGNSMRWNKTKDGWSVMVVDSKKMYDIVYEDVVRQNEKKNEEIAAKKTPSPSKNSERDSQADKTGNTLTYDQAIERYGLPQAERKLASGRTVSQWEKREGISGRGQSGYGSGGGWQNISGGNTLIMVCTFNDKGVLEKQTFNFGPTFGGEESKRRRCERYFMLE